MVSVNSRPFLGTREQTRDVITRDKPTKRAAVQERHKTVVAGALLLHLLCQIAISSHGDGGIQQEGSVQRIWTAQCYASCWNPGFEQGPGH
jgi:hypothetical protein